MPRFTTCMFMALLAASPGLTQGKDPATGKTRAIGEAGSSAKKKQKGAAIPGKGDSVEARKKDQEEKKAEIRKRIRRMRARMKKGEYVQTHVRVRVTLRNHEKIVGVVKHGRFVERSNGLEFVLSDMKAKGAGIRIWYYNKTNGFIFIPYRQIRTYRVLKRLSEVEVRSIHEKMTKAQAEARKAGERRAREIAERNAARKSGEKSAKKLDDIAKKQEDEAKAKAEEERLLKLLKEFPEKDGWGEDRIKEIQRRIVAIKIYPSKQEQRFIDSFEDWKKAKELVLKKAEEAKKAKEGKKTAEPAKGGSADPKTKEPGKDPGGIEPGQVDPGIGSKPGK